MKITARALEAAHNSYTGSADINSEINNRCPHIYHCQEFPFFYFTYHSGLRHNAIGGMVIMGEKTTTSELGNLDIPTHKADLHAKYNSSDVILVKIKTKKNVR
jgi:hypothetical protein